MKLRLMLVASSALLLAGCPFDDDDSPSTSTNPDSPSTPTSASYTVTVKNLTAAQPVSPVAVLAHNDNFALFTTGEAASVPLEVMAEGGNNADLLAFSSDDNVTLTMGGTGPIPPGGQESFTFTVDPSSAGYLSVAGMLVNTNDAFAGFSAMDISALEAGDKERVNAVIWDAGTEVNDELAANIPGPAGGGEGVNAARGSDDQVTVHPGVISSDDGLTTSALLTQHRFLNPGISVTIERTE
ncbi:spondin domain-containing protein [Enterovibrio norvegicus]|uniref:spondin domain-containing protein n=1 Tax=Enterovibrio norvegicus TaxID=188144 RepID=UPI00352DBD53